MTVEYMPLKTSDGDENADLDVDLRPLRPSRFREVKFWLSIGMFVLLIVVCILLAVAPLHEGSSKLKNWKSTNWPFREDIPGSRVSEFANYEYWRERLGQPKREDAEEIIDRIVEHADDYPSPIKDISISKQSKDKALFIPTFVSLRKLSDADEIYSMLIYESLATITSP